MLRACRGSGCPPKGSFIDEVNALRFPSSGGWGFRSFHTVFWGFAPRCSSVYRLPHSGCGQAQRTEALAIPSSTPHASHSSPECPQNSTHEEKNPHLSTPLLQWDGIPHSISQSFLEHIYTGLALGSPLLGPITAQITHPMAHTVANSVSLCRSTPGTKEDKIP